MRTLRPLLTDASAGTAAVADLQATAARLPPGEARTIRRYARQLQNAYTAAAAQAAWSADMPTPIITTNAPRLSEVQLREVRLTTPPVRHR